MSRGPRPTVEPGDRFGRLVVVREAGRAGPHRTFECLCDCGQAKVVRSNSLRTGRTRSCGCLHRETSRAHAATLARTAPRHGHAVGGHLSPTYRSWAAMLTRCRNPGGDDWALYGGRGVTVCDRWLTFENFLADMGERPEGMSIDRIDSHGNYEPGNCRWATPKEQRANQRRAKAAR